MKSAVNMFVKMVTYADTMDWTMMKQDRVNCLRTQAGQEERTGHRVTVYSGCAYISIYFNFH